MERESTLNIIGEGTVPTPLWLRVLSQCGEVEDATCQDSPGDQNSRLVANLLEIASRTGLQNGARCLLSGPEHQVPSLQHCGRRMTSSFSHRGRGSPKMALFAHSKDGPMV